MILIFERSRLFFQQRLLYCTKITNKNEIFFLNEQRSRDAAAKKRANTSGVGKSNNYYEDIYIIMLPGPGPVYIYKLRIRERQVILKAILHFRLAV